MKKLKLYEIKYGNGWNGSRNNLGKELVLAEDIKTAKKILSEHNNVKLGHIGKALQIPFLQSNIEGTVEGGTKSNLKEIKLDGQWGKINLHKQL